MSVNKLMKQAQQMQKKLMDAQARLGELEIEGTAGGGKVGVVLDGKGFIKNINIDPTVVDPADVEILSDLLVAAHNDAKTKMDAIQSEQMSGLLPAGMNLPF